MSSASQKWIREKNLMTTETNKQRERGVTTEATSANPPKGKVEVIAATADAKTTPDNGSEHATPEKTEVDIPILQTEGAATPTSAEPDQASTPPQDPSEKLTPPVTSANQCEEPSTGDENPVSLEELAVLINNSHAKAKANDEEALRSAWNAGNWLELAYKRITAEQGYGGWGTYRRRGSAVVAGERGQSELPDLFRVRIKAKQCSIGRTNRHRPPLLDVKDVVAL